MSNRLTKIYTRTGDDGTTELSSRERIDKSDVRIEAMGDIDELNSILGLLRSNNIPSEVSGYLLNVQHRLFDVGAELAIPGNAIISPESVEKLENLIDIYNSELPALKDEEYYYADLILMQVESEEGELLGEVKAVHDFGAGPVLEVSGKITEMVPFTKSYVISIDLKQNKIKITDLYLKLL